MAIDFDDIMPRREQRMLDQVAPNLSQNPPGIDLPEIPKRLVDRINTELAGGGGGMPPVTGVPGAVIVEANPATAYEQRRLRQADIDPDFAISSFNVSGGSLIETFAPYDNPTFTASYTQPITAGTIRDNVGGPTVPLTLPGTAFGYTGSYGGPAGVLNAPGNAVAFTLDAQEGAAVDSDNVTVRSATRVFYGKSAPGTIDDAFADALANNPLRTSNSGSDSVNLAGAENWYLIFPDRYGLPTVTNFGLAIPMVDLGTFTKTNAFGFAETYRALRNVNAGIGTFSPSWS